MTISYDHRAVEAEAQLHWENAGIFLAIPDPLKPKFYACSMLPYPSGKLHMGHVRNYTINDVLARHMRMKGYNVLMPMGWDSFGLPAENAALSSGSLPAEWTDSNIAEMKNQMKPLGFSFDWSKEISTCDPSYYRWSQWMFLKLYEKGIVYKYKQYVNWDPIDKTVLANEQVVDGRGWRSGALIERREIPGYYLRISAYSEELLASIDDLKGWPDKVKSMQKNWIGKVNGFCVRFSHSVESSDGVLLLNGYLWAFIENIEFLSSAAYCIVSPSHILARRLFEISPSLLEKFEGLSSTSAGPSQSRDAEFVGVDTGWSVVNPINNTPVTLWVGQKADVPDADCAVVGVPAHSQKDFEFARYHNIDIVGIDEQINATPPSQQTKLEISRQLSGIAATPVRTNIFDDLARLGAVKDSTVWRLRDWGISRQRYWGTPIPMIYCDCCGDVPVPYCDLPVVLPRHLAPNGSGNPLVDDKKFTDAYCPKCGNLARRETDTMDTFVDSSWYYMRYCDTNNNHSMVGDGAKYWMPVDQYIGGIEHAVMHLLYARFWTKVMRDEGLVEFSEPFTKLFTQGMLLSESYYQTLANGSRQWLYPSEVNVEFDPQSKLSKAYTISDGAPVTIGSIEKMSKSKNNLIEPSDIIEKYGADTARLFTIFIGPPDQSAVWSDSGLQGCFRFLKKIWTFAASLSRQKIQLCNYVNQRGSPDLNAKLNIYLKQINGDYDRLQYNTVVSGAMKMMKSLDAIPEAEFTARFEGFRMLLLVLHPITPHITHALWCELEYPGEIHNFAWPVHDDFAIGLAPIEISVQVNGKFKGSLKIHKDASKDEVVAKLREKEIIKLPMPEISKVIFVPNRLVNLVG